MTDAITCPVCAPRTKREALESQLFIWSGVEAIANSDASMVETLYENMTPYDGHTAVSMLAQTLGDMFDLIGSVDVKATLARYRMNIQLVLDQCA